MFTIPLLHAFLPETPAGLAQTIDFVGRENGEQFMNMNPARGSIVVEKHFRASFAG